MSNRSLRKTQLVSPFGPGAIYDILGESFIVTDTSRWDKGRILKSLRLEKIFGDNAIIEPPVGKKRFKGDNPKGVELLRFPRWLFCPRCRKLQFWDYREQEKGTKPDCSYCYKSTLVPMRFVQVCRNGHISDVNWSYFVHKKGNTCKSSRLEFRSESQKGGGLESLYIKCIDCNAKKNLGDITQKDYLKRSGIKCSGRQPWQSPANSVECDDTPQVIQRGASNIYFPRIVSALDLPPESYYSEEFEELEKIRESSEFKTLSTFEKGDTIFDLMLQTVVNRYGTDEKTVLSLLDGQRKFHQDNLEIEEAEWIAFNKKYTREFHEKDTFITEHVEILNNEAKENKLYCSLESLIDKVVIARRIREVRVLKGYHRYKPDGEEISPSHARGLGRKYPGLEVFGEGLFITLNENKLREWENQSAVIHRAGEIQNMKDVSVFKSWLPDPSPRFLLLHTFAHILIRQMAFESGYSSASLRERVYANCDHLGLTPY